MGVGAGLSMYVVVVKKFTFAISSPDEFLLGLAFAASRVQHLSDLHSKFALGPHHVSKYGRHPTCGR